MKNVPREALVNPNDFRYELHDLCNCTPNGPHGALASTNNPQSLKCPLFQALSPRRDRFYTPHSSPPSVNRRDRLYTEEMEVLVKEYWDLLFVRGT